MNADNQDAYRAGPIAPAVGSQARRAMVFTAAGMLAGQAGASATIGRIARSPSTTVWQLIEALTRQVPFSRQSVGAALGVSLVAAEQPGNESFEFWTCPPVLLSDGVEVRVDLRLKRVGTHPGFMVLNALCSCVALADARARYPELEISESPRGHSMNDTTSYSTAMPWGRLSFGFAYPGPECLRSVAFAPTA